MKFSIATGWLSPKGEFYPCSVFEHRTYAVLISRKLNLDLNMLEADDDLCKLGWLKVMGNNTMTGSFITYDCYNLDSEIEVTQAQLDAIFDYSIQYTCDSDMVNLKRFKVIA